MYLHIWRDYKNIQIYYDKMLGDKVIDILLPTAQEKIVNPTVLIKAVEPTYNSSI